MSAQGVDVPNVIKIDSAVAALHMREKKHDIAWVFFVTGSIARSENLPVFNLLRGRF